MVLNVLFPICEFGADMSVNYSYMMTREHVRNISPHFLARGGGAPECQKVRRYIPYMLELSIM